MRYDDVSSWLGWPEARHTFDPVGAGAHAYAEMARKKIGGALEQAFPGISVDVGVIVADPYSDRTENPLAVVCQFARPARDAELDLAHRLAWNFSRTALLVTLEPQRLIAWSCHQHPARSDAERRVCALNALPGVGPTGTIEEGQVRDLLHWVNLVTSKAQHQLPEKFPADGRADALLLQNLRLVRAELRNMGLHLDFCHDLLARVIFTQFLFHRKDREGNAFFNARILKRLHHDGVLSKLYVDGDLSEILRRKDDTYALFRWMDSRFNGDLFPGHDDDDPDTREAAWAAERDAVDERHLQLLSDLVRGDLDIGGKQFTLWPHYSFDTIPLEFISSIYEEFITAEEKAEDKAYYTPSHLVDYVLDSVLPWNGQDWNLRILDPCCGSGIFLVKAFQRLIHRWRLANPDKEPMVADLRPILASNLVGVDKNKEAVRVACFSLYLAMADAIEPKHYVTRENAKVFPRLRGSRLLARDFFDEQTPGISSVGDNASYHLVIGNAPWGDGSILAPKMAGETNQEHKKRTKSSPSKAQVWAKDPQNDWPVANFDIGPVFLGKAARLVKETGRVAMIETASMLNWQDGAGVQLRKKLFGSFTFDEITNLSLLRRDTFFEAIGPSCVVVYSSRKPRPDTLLHYFTPKASRIGRDAEGASAMGKGFAIEPQDVGTLTHEEAATNHYVWHLLTLGSRRDLKLVQRLMQLPNLAQLENEGRVVTRLGVIPGNKQQEFPEHKKRRFLAAAKFPENTHLWLDANRLPTWDEPRVADSDSTNFEAFKLPQMLIKQSFSTQDNRFRAAIVKTKHREWGVISTKAYLSVRDLENNEARLRAACLVYNSQLAAYFLGLTSPRMAFNTEVLSRELVTVPLPESFAVPGEFVTDTPLAIDEVIRSLFSLTAADWSLIEDFLTFTLPDVLRKTPGPGRQPTRRSADSSRIEPELWPYVETFFRVLQGTLGEQKPISATIYVDPENRRLPVRMLTLHLGALRDEPISTKSMTADGLLDALAELHAGTLRAGRRAVLRRGLGFQRVAYFLQPGHESGRRTMNVTIVKPDETRYWTRSMAMRDADSLTGSIVAASREKGGGL